MNADEAAALYRLMTWLSPSFPVGAFSYSSGIEWAVEAGDITDAASLRDWLAAMLGDGSGFCDARVSGAGASRRIRAGRRGLARDRRTRGRLRALARAPARDHDAGPRLHRDRALGLGLRRARRHGRGLRRRDRLSRRGRRRQRGARRSAGAGDARLPACRGVELDFRRRAAGSARADRQPAHSAQASKPMSPPPRSARWQPRSTISAAPPSAPISPACVTRRSTRGCSGHDAALTSSLRTQGPITTACCYDGVGLLPMMDPRYGSLRSQGRR